MSNVTQTASDHLFAQGTDETKRLNRQADVLRRFTRYLLDSAGTRSVDMGTGIGEVAFPMAERVGPQGAFVGVDRHREAQDGEDRDPWGRLHWAVDGVAAGTARP